MRVCTLIFFAILSGAVTGSGTAAYVVNAVALRAGEPVALPAPVTPSAPVAEKLARAAAVAPIARGVAEAFGR